VLVVRLLTEGSIEEHILQVAEQKRKFADSSITGTLGNAARLVH
jgi:SNF2 family DNA or RNA helicase